MPSVALTSGLICGALLVLGFGLVLPVSAGVCNLCSLAAVGSGMVFVGSLDNV